MLYIDDVIQSVVSGSSARGSLTQETMETTSVDYAPH